MSFIHNIINHLIVLDSGQKQRFIQYIPQKVYKTERNIAILVAFTQLIMILIFLISKQKAFNSTRGIQYFSLYVTLLIATLLAIVLYRYTICNQKDKAFLWVRRGYAVVICVWVTCITLIEAMNGKGITVFCYLLPTLAALLLLTPKEGIVLFGGTWLVLITFFSLYENQYMFSNIVNSTFVTALTLFISFRYYHSMAVEFCDRETISNQYQEIEESNALLETMAQIDQLTNLFNRHYLLEKIYPLFDEYKDKQYYGMFLMLDIDYFKQYNDKYGHVQGDECLKQLAKLLKKACSDMGVSALRYGGEEFLLIKMSDEPLDGKHFAQLILDAVKKENMKRDDVALSYVTISIGVWSSSLQTIPHIENAIKHADDALYKAKEMGRNCIAIAE